MLEFKYRDRTLYAAYCHLSAAIVQNGEKVVRSQVIGCTGRTGNQSNQEGEDLHLHFEIRTEVRPPRGAGRIDPASLYGRAPVNTMFVQGHGAKPPTGGAGGVKVAGMNVLP